jgi:tyrosine-protein kinase Etk/Wzc
MATDTEIAGLGRRIQPDGLQEQESAPVSDQEVHLLDFLLMLAERRRLVVAVAASVAFVGVAVAFILPVRYTATVTIMPPQQNSSLGSSLTSELGGLSSMAALVGAGSGLGLKNPNDMYVAMLKSHIVEDALIQRFDLMKEYHRSYLSDTRKVFERRASIEGGLKDGLIHISFEDKNKQRAAEIANAYVDQFRSLSQHLAITEASRRRLFFEQQFDEAKNNLTNAEGALAKTQQRTGLIQLDSQARVLIESAAMLRAQISAKEVQIQGMRSYATGENAAVEESEQELASMRSQLAKLGGSEETGSAGLIVPKGQITEAGLDYLRKMRDVKLAKLDEAREGAMIQVVDPALPPDKRSWPKRGLISICAVVSGLTLGILFALLQGSLQRAERNPRVREKIGRLRNAVFLRKRWTA